MWVFFPLRSVSLLAGAEQVEYFGFFRDFSLKQLHGVDDEPKQQGKKKDAERLCGADRDCRAADN